MPQTANFDWETPDVGGDTGAWGPIVNAAFDAVDADLKTVKDTADAALPKAGGVMTGRVDVHSATMKRSDIGNIDTAQGLDLSVAQAFTATVTGAVTLTISNTPAGQFLVGFILRLENGGSAAITWPASVRWPAGSPPTFTAAGVDILVFVTFDGGTTWELIGIQQDLS